MRIGIDGRYLRDDYPGIGRYIFHLAQALPALAPDHQFFLLHNLRAGGRQPSVEALSRPNLTLVPTEIPIRSVGEQIRLPRLARRLALDIFHAPYYVTAYRMPCRRVVTIYDVISARYPEYLPSPALRVVFEAATRLALRADHILTLSDASRQDLIDMYGVAPGRLTVTPLAAGSHFRPVDSVIVAELRTRLGLPGRYALYVGINKPHKNLLRLIDAWALVEAQGTGGCHLVIAGHEDPRYPQTRRRAAALGLDSVVFLGRVAEGDLPTLYTGAELFIFPSLYEGFGLPVIEAMACGTPVACSNTSSLPEVAGDAALLFDPHTAEAIASAIRPALGNPDVQAELRRRSLEQAGSFSWERTARRTLEVYQRLAGLGRT